MNSPAWAPTAAAVAGLVSDRNLVDGSFADPTDDSPGTEPTLSWVEARIEAVATRVGGFAAGSEWLGSVAGEYVLYTVAADVDSGWTAGRQIDQYSRSTEYRKMAQNLYLQLTGADGSGSSTGGAGSPSYSFPEPGLSDTEVW